MIKCDLHCHSKYSSRPTNWITKKTRAHESYTEPEFIFKTAMKNGMTHVTITDHNEIGGCLELQKYPNTFISCEVTARFPEDRCKIHIPVYGITEKQYNDIMDIRKDVYELSQYIDENNIYHTVAHLLFSVNHKLKNHHLEKILTMFNFFELNGFRSSDFNLLITHIVKNLSKELLEDLARKHNIENPKTDPENKLFTCGSDDHSGVFIAKSYTENPGNDYKDFFENGDKNIINLKESNPKHLAYALYNISYTYFQKQLNVSKYIEKDTGLQVLDKILSGDSDKKQHNGIISSVRNIKHKLFKNEKKITLKQQIIETLGSLKHYSNGLNTDNVSENWFKVVSEMSNACIKDVLIT